MYRYLLAVSFVVVIGSCGTEKNNADIHTQVQTKVTASVNEDELWDIPPQLVSAPKMEISADVLGVAEEDNVELKIRVTEEGIVDSAWVYRSRNFPVLDSLALANARRLVFIPARKNGKVISVEIFWAHLFRFTDPQSKTSKIENDSNTGL